MPWAPFPARSRFLFHRSGIPAMPFSLGCEELKQNANHSKQCFKIRHRGNSNKTPRRPDTRFHTPMSEITQAPERGRKLSRRRRWPRSRFPRAKPHWRKRSPLKKAAEPASATPSRSIEMILILITKVNRTSSAFWTKKAGVVSGAGLRSPGQARQDRPEIGVGRLSGRGRHLRRPRRRGSARVSAADRPAAVPRERP